MKLNTASYCTEEELHMVNYFFSLILHDFRNCCFLFKARNVLLCWGKFQPDTQLCVTYPDRACLLISAEKRVTRWLPFLSYSLTCNYYHDQINDDSQCLSVCLIVGKTAKKIYEWILLTFSGNLDNGPRNRRLHLVSPDSRLWPLVFQRSELMEFDH